MLFLVCPLFPSEAKQGRTQKESPFFITDIKRQQYRGFVKKWNTFERGPILVEGYIKSTRQGLLEIRGKVLRVPETRRWVTYSICPALLNIGSQQFLWEGNEPIQPFNTNGLTESKASQHLLPDPLCCEKQEGGGSHSQRQTLRERESGADSTEVVDQHLFPYCARCYCCFTVFLCINLCFSPFANPRWRWTAVGHFINHPAFLIRSLAVNAKHDWQWYYIQLWTPL